MKLTLFLMRHGFAGAPVRDDPQYERERVLTDEGRMQVAAVAQQMILLGIIPKTIFCSDYVRARQTADIVGAKFKKNVDPHNSLGPDVALGAFIENLINSDGIDGQPNDRVLIVGHRDNMIPLIAQLTGKDPGQLLTAELRVLRVKKSMKSAKQRDDLTIRPSDLRDPSGARFRPLLGMGNDEMTWTPQAAPWGGT